MALFIYLFIYIMAGLIVDMLLMLFSINNAMKQAENEWIRSILAKGYSTI